MKKVVVDFGHVAQTEDEKLLVSYIFEKGRQLILEGAARSSKLDIPAGKGMLIVTTVFEQLAKASQLSMDYAIEQAKKLKEERES